MLAPNGDGATIEAARRAGADGYVLRNDRRTELMSAITALAAHEHYSSTPALHTAATMASLARMPCGAATPRRC